ncbi:hypothetical protein B5E95_04870 [Lactobacillus gallinarum]|nr:hypothetical protein B5E95_04870 [Lactobacillus gallinarum]
MIKSVQFIIAIYEFHFLHFFLNILLKSTTKKKIIESEHQKKMFFTHFSMKKTVKCVKYG